MKTTIQSIIVILVSGFGMAHAEVREFTDIQGRKVTGELVSHNGSGVLELKREDGNLFQVELTRLSPQDRGFVQEWIKRTAPKMDYRFETKAAAEKLAGNRRDFGYKKVKNELWSYRVEVKNLARNTVGNLKIEYRVFVKNEAQGAFTSTEMSGYHSGTHALPNSLRYNESVSFVTTEVPLDSVDYNDYYNSRNRHQDALRGLMLRIKDAQGKVVHEYVSPITTLQGKTWDSFPPGMEIKSK